MYGKMKNAIDIYSVVKFSFYRFEISTLTLKGTHRM